MSRGRRVNSSGVKSKQLLLEKALELFSTKGYYETKISDIVQAANLTQPTFYLYFQSKESLYKDINTEFQKQFLRIMKEHLNVAQHQSITPTIQDCLKNLFDYFLANPHLTKIGFYNSEEAYAVKERFSQKLLRIFNDHLSKEMLNGVEPNIFVNSLIGTIERLTLTMLLTYESNSEQLASDIVKMYFANERVLVG